jgi:hypothetical protein
MVLRIQNLVCLTVTFSLVVIILVLVPGFVLVVLTES